MKLKIKIKTLFFFKKETKKIINEMKQMEWNWNISGRIWMKNLEWIEIQSEMKFFSDYFIFWNDTRYIGHSEQNKTKLTTLHLSSQGW